MIRGGCVSRKFRVPTTERDGTAHQAEIGPKREICLVEMRNKSIFFNFTKERASKAQSNAEGFLGIRISSTAPARRQRRYVEFHV